MDWAALAVTPQRNGVKALIERGERIPAGQLQRIRTIMRPLLNLDDSDTAQYGRAAARLNACGFQTVIMGHTHLPREVRDAASRRASYINCGTWIDAIEIPPHTLDRPASTEVDPLEAALRALLEGSLRRSFSPHWADVLVAPDGNVQEALLKDTWS
jgi:hypothetical protein